MNYQIAQDFTNAIGGIASLAAAWGWFRASAVTIPPFPDVGFDSASAIFEPVHKALRDSSRLNKRAAFFSGIAALAFCISFVAQITSERGGAARSTVPLTTKQN